MPVEAHSGQSQVILLIGESASLWRAHRPAELPPVRAIGDVYAALVLLLKASGDSSLPPAAVLVSIESLRGDELRFFDLLARRWPGLPVAAVYQGDPQDRKLDVCRRKAVAVVPVSAIDAWLMQAVTAAEPAGHVESQTILQVRAVPVAPSPVLPEKPVAPTRAKPVVVNVSPKSDTATATKVTTPPASHPISSAPAPSVEPKPPVAGPAAPAPAKTASQSPPVPREAPEPDQKASETPSASASRDPSGIHEMAEESFVDLPDELMAHLPDHLDDEELPDQAPVYDEPDYDLEAELPPEDDADPPPEAPAADEDEGSGPPPQHMTPWSAVPRPQRKRPVRKPPKTDRSADDAAEEERQSARGDLPDTVSPAGPAAVDPESASPPAAGPAKPPKDASRPADYGLLTPEELRALLQDPEQDNDRREDRP